MLSYISLKVYTNFGTLPILTTNINFNSWDDVFYDPFIANAILDRILHHAHVVNITGRSYRLKEYMTQDEE